MKKYFSLKPCLLFIIMFGITGILCAQNEMELEGIRYRVFITGNGDDAVADSAWVIGHYENLGNMANIPSSVSYDYIYSKFIGYDAQNKPIYQTVSRFLNAPVKRIANNAFSGCSGLISVNIPNSVTWIGRSAFSRCSGLTSVNIPNSITSIEDSTFYSCSSLTSINIPNSVTRIGDWAFYYCSGLTSVNIPNSVTSIGGMAFAGCTSLTSVNIPNSVTWIGGSAFSGCSGLTSVNIPNIKYIGLYAFRDCDALTTLTIGNSITDINIDPYAFFHCYNLKSLIWKAKNASSFQMITEEIDDDYEPILYCSIEDVLIDNTVETIPDYFLSNSNITEVNIPNSVKRIGAGAFNTCRGLLELTIPNSVTSIGDWAFYRCSGLSSINIPNSVTSIGDWAFTYCSGVTHISLSNNLETIGSSSFSNCFKLTEITIPNSVTVIGNYAFNDCWRLAKVTIGESVTSELSFSGCDSIKEFVWNAKYCKLTNIGRSRIKKVTFGDKVEYIPRILLNSNYEVIIPSSATTLSTYYNNDNIVETTTIYWNAKNCKLEETEEDGYIYSIAGLYVIIGKDVESIGDYIFCPHSDSEDEWLEANVTCHAVIPPRISKNCFTFWGDDEVFYEIYVLRVPAESLDAYRNAEGWKEFLNIVPIEDETICGDVNGDNSVSIDDLTALIDMLLSGDTTGNDRADVDGDGNVTIVDVTVLIDILLTGN